jgi:putative ABC transport system ATP-binding protein
MQNVLSPLLPIGIKKEHKERADFLLNEVGLEKRKHHMPNKLSGGESQRVAIARALIMNAPIILADEPTGNLDSNSGEVVLNLMKNINQQIGTSFVIVTHDPRVAMNTQRVVFLKDGEIHEEPTVDMPL